MYDPVISSFLSVDRYVQQPENSQGFNRYAYCMYNPLKYVDPSGWVVSGASLGTPIQGPFGWGTNFAPVYEWRDICDPSVRSKVASAILTSYMVGNGCSISGNIAISNDGKIGEIQTYIDVSSRFSNQLNSPIVFETGGCVLTALGSTNRYWFTEMGKYGNDTKTWGKKAKEFNKATNRLFNSTATNIVKFIEWNDEKGTYKQYEASIIPVSEIMEALLHDYAVAAGVNLVQSEDITQNSGEKGHFANISFASLSQDGSMITLEFIEPNGTSIMTTLMLPTTGLTNTYLPKEKFSAIGFFKYKLIVNP